MFDYPNNGCFLDYFSMQLVLYMRTRYYMCARVNISRIARDITILFVETGTEGGGFGDEKEIKIVVGKM